MSEQAFVAVTEDRIVVVEDATHTVLAEAPSTFTVTTAMGDVGPMGPPGQTGPAGPTGQPRWQGQGPPPALIVGAQAGDVYLDTLTGDLYTLT